jgi:hypothetical protein
VYLENGYTFHKTPYGKGVAINDVRGLHAMIGRMIARRQRLTGAELRLLHKEMARFRNPCSRPPLGTTEQDVSLWERRGCCWCL